MPAFLQDAFGMKHLNGTYKNISETRNANAKQLLQEQLDREFLQVGSRSLDLNEVKKLVEAGANIHTTDKEGNNVNHLRFSTIRTPWTPDYEIVNYLALKGLNRDAKNNAGETYEDVKARTLRWKVLNSFYD